MHDATLQEITFNWVTKSGLLILKTSKGIKEVKFNNFTSVVIPRDCPWGESTSVNSFEILDLDNMSYKLSLEMQSGDVIIIIADSIALPE